MPRKLLPFAICYDFDGTLAPGNMQERDFIPQIGMTKKAFWEEVKTRCKKHHADEILIYMGLMLDKANQAEIQVRREDFATYGAKLELFDGVSDWFARINKYGRSTGFKVTHHIISSGIREMVLGTGVARYFDDVYASSFVFDHHGVAKWPALALNYTTKTQYLFRINKGVKDVFDHAVINDYVRPEDRRSRSQILSMLATDRPTSRASVSSRIWAGTPLRYTNPTLKARRPDRKSCSRKAE